MKFYLALMAGFAALAVHFYLAKHYHELNLGLSSGSAVCNINQTFNCDSVAASRFSTFLGVPIALWGFTTQLILLLFTFVFGLGLSSDKNKIGRYTLYLSLFVAITSLIMGGISMLFLGTYCLFCIFAYLLSFAHLYATWGLQEHVVFKEFANDLKSALTDFRWVGISAASIIPLTFLVNNMFLDHFGGSMIKDAVESSLMSWQGNPPNNFGTDGLSKGPSDARMTIVEFADFLCPHCKHAVPSLKVFAESHPDVRIIYKIFPLDGNCNASTDMPKGDGTRCLLSKTVYCAEKLAQKGSIFYEEIFAQQEMFMGPSATADLLKAIVEKSGIDSAAMETCRNSEEAHNNIIAQSKEGADAKIEGTPSIFVNGKFLPRGQLLPVLQRVYNTLE